MIGSHNTFSYLPPINFWGKITKLWGKCQDKTLAEQYDSGVRFFDIRVKYINGCWHFVHNNVDYGLVDFDFIRYFQHENCYLRIIYDLRHFPKNESEPEAKDQFNFFLRYVSKIANVAGIIAITYWDWETKIIGEVPARIAEFHASVSAPWYQYLLGTKWWANKNNAKIKSDYKNYIDDLDSVILIDFV